MHPETPLQGYHEWFIGLVKTIRDSQLKASLKVNTELLSLYWYLGSAITEKQMNAEWGDKIITQLAIDLKAELRESKGFSRSNLFNISKWYQFYASHLPLVQQAVGLTEDPEQGTHHLTVQQAVGLFPAALGLIPWGHHIQIFTRSASIDEALFYLKQTSTHNWSRALLTYHFDTNLFHRTGKAPNNFEMALPKPQSDLAREILKNPLNLDFLSLGEEATERDLENAMLSNIKKLLLEMGNGFAFCGQQHRISIGEKDFYIDLLFYHTRLHCYFVVELKVTELEAEHIGKLDLYITAIDEQIKLPEDNPTIGLLLCKIMDKVVAEYTLKTKTKPMGISEYRHTIPDEWKHELPAEEILRKELIKEISIPVKPVDEKLKNLKKLIQKLNKEEARHEKDNDCIEKVIRHVQLPLIKLIDKQLTAIKDEFKHTKITLKANGRFIGDYSKNIDLVAITPPDTWLIECEFLLEGFKKAGTKAFDVWQKLEIRLEKYKYSIGERSMIWDEKLYHQTLSVAEMESISNRFTELFIDSISEKLEQLVGQF